MEKSVKRKNFPRHFGAPKVSLLLSCDTRLNVPPNVGREGVRGGCESTDSFVGGVIFGREGERATASSGILRKASWWEKTVMNSLWYRGVFRHVTLFIFVDGTRLPGLNKVNSQMWSEEWFSFNENQVSARYKMPHYSWNILPLAILNFTRPLWTIIVTERNIPASSIARKDSLVHARQNINYWQEKILSCHWLVTPQLPVPSLRKLIALKKEKFQVTGFICFNIAY